MNIAIGIWKDQDTLDTHATMNFAGKRTRRTDTARTICARKLAGFTRLAPHSNPAKSVPITCGICLGDVIAINDIMDGFGPGG